MYNYTVMISYWGKLTCVPSVPTTQMYFSGTVTQFWDTSTILLAFRIPKPNALLTQNPAPFFLQPGLSFREEYSAVHVMICCISRHVRLGLKQYILSFIPSHSQQFFDILTFNFSVQHNGFFIDFKSIRNSGLYKQTKYKQSIKGSKTERKKIVISTQNQVKIS